MKTSSVEQQHHWLSGGSRADREAATRRLGLLWPVLAVDADRRLRGPYTAAGTLVRMLAPEIGAVRPEILARHDLEVLAVAPELDGVVSNRRETPLLLAAPEERTRFVPRARTQGIAHGLTELLIEWLQDQAGPRVLVFEHVDGADHSDLEWLAVLVRRLPPHLGTVVLRSRRTTLPATLADAVAGHVAGQDVVGVRRHRVTRRRGTGRDAAIAYVASECLSDDPYERAAYLSLAPEERGALHDARGDELETSDEPSLRLGAIPFHRELGSDAGTAGAAALSAALERCVLLGFYHAALELGDRCLRLLDWRKDPERCWIVTAHVCTALTALDRADEAAAAYEDACARTTLPSVHLQAAHERALLVARFSDEPRLDRRRAKALINTAIAISSLLPDEERRSFDRTLDEHGVAQIEMHLGDPYEALRLVTTGLQRLAAELGPDEQSARRSALRDERARLLAGVGELDLAVREYTRCLAADPHHSELYVERAALHRRLGNTTAALADYDAAARSGPPHPEPHYHRGDLLLELGHVEAAHDAFRYVLELDPTCVDAYSAIATADIAR